MYGRMARCEFWCGGKSSREVIWAQFVLISVPLIPTPFVTLSHFVQNLNNSAPQTGVSFWSSWSSRESRGISRKGSSESFLLLLKHRYQTVNESQGDKSYIYFCAKESKVWEIWSSKLQARSQGLCTRWVSSEGAIARLVLDEWSSVSGQTLPVPFTTSLLSLMTHTVQMTIHLISDRLMLGPNLSSHTISRTRHYYCWFVLYISLIL